MSTSTLNTGATGATTSGLAYNLTPGSITIGPNQYVYSVAVITGTQKIQIVGSARMRVI